MLLFGAGKGLSGATSTAPFVQHKEPIELMNKCVRLIAGSSSHNILITEDNYVYVIGSNHSGKLGILSNIADQSAWVQIQHEAFQPSAPKLIDISTGFDFSIILAADGKAYGCGTNDDRQLGEIKPTETYQQLSVDNVTHIACGAFHSALVQSCSVLFTSGWNTDKQLGREADVNGFRPIPTKSHEHKPIKLVKCGNRSTIVLTRDHSLYVAGSAEHSNLSDRTLIPDTLFYRVNFEYASRITKILTGYERFISFNFRYHCTCFIVDDKDLYASGLNSLEMFGRIGECKQITKLNWKVLDGKPVQAYSGYQHLVVVTSDGRAYSAGEHQSEQSQCYSNDGIYSILPHQAFTAVGGGYHNTILIYDERMKKKDRRFVLLHSAQYNGYLSDIDFVRN